MILRLIALVALLFGLPAVVCASGVGGGGGNGIGGVPTTLTNETLAGTTNFTGAARSTAACATGYTRNGPNYCELTGTDSGQIVDTTCTSKAIPATARAVHVNVDAIVKSANATGLRSTVMRFYTDSGCGTGIGSSTEDVRLLVFEQVATVANTTLAEVSSRVIVNLVADGLVGSTNLWAKVNAGGATVTIGVLGYWD